jgi:hypothetical protein
MVISTNIEMHDMLPNIKGAIDGSHIMILKPSHPLFEIYLYHKTRPRYSIAA